MMLIQVWPNRDGQAAYSRMTLATSAWTTCRNTDAFGAR